MEIWFYWELLLGLGLLLFFLRVFWDFTLELKYGLIDRSGELRINFADIDSFLEFRVFIKCMN